MTILDIPYVSQLEDGARKYNNDCGAASGVMLVQAYKGDQTLTVDEYYKKTGQNTDQYLSASQVRSVLNQYDIPTTWRINVTEDDVRLLIGQKRPMIVLFNYKKIRENGISTEIPFSGFHFAVLVGIDDFFVYLNDPLWTNERGKNLQIPLDVWMQAWTEFPLNSNGVPANPARGALIPDFALNDVGIEEGEIYLLEAKRMRVIFPGGMNVRSGPGTKYSTVDARNHGDVVMILDTRVSGGNTWGCLGPNRWIAIEYNSNTYLVPDFPGGTDDPADHETYEVVHPHGLNVRSGPDISYPIVDTLLSGQKIKVYATKDAAEDIWGRIGIGQWVAIKYQGEELAKKSE